MKSAEYSTDKVFADAHYTIHYRAARRARWHSEARPDYAALFLLDGEMHWSATGSGGGEDGNEDAEARRDAERAPRDDAGVVGRVGEHAAATREAGRLQAGGVLFVNPGGASEARGERVEFLALTLAPSFVLDCAARARLTRADSVVSFRAHAASQDERLRRLAREFAEELLTETAGQEMVLAALVEQTLVHLLRRHANIRRSPEVELSRVGLIDRRIRRAVELMHAHLDRDLPLEEIAAAAYVSPFHFARLFKKLTGASPHAYLAALRVARAQTLLAETDLSVTEVGARVGYNSSSHFAKAFRRSTGLSPSAFRAALVRR